MPKKVLFVYNPTAGRGSIGQKLESIVDVFSSNNYDVIVHPTKRANDAYSIIPEYKDFADLIVVAGGDGTINEAISAMVKIPEGPPLGVIPAGSTNDFANSIRISKNPVEAAVDIMAGQETLIDAGLFNDKPYAYIAGFGLFTDIAYSTAQSAKNVFGYFAYLWEAGRELFNVPNYHIKYRIEGEENEGDFIYGMVTNSMSVAGVKNLPGRNIYMDDGLFELTMVKNLKNPLELGEVMVCLISGEQTPYIVRKKTDYIEFSTEDPMPWTIDGEDGGRHSHVVIKTLKQKVRIMAPSNLTNLEINKAEEEIAGTHEDTYDEYN